MSVYYLKAFKSGHKALFSHRELNFKTIKILVLSERTFVIRHAGVQI